MTERENEGVVPCKRIKLSHEISNCQKEGNLEAGNYWLGPIIKEKRPHVTQRLARRKGTDSCYFMKMLVFNDRDATNKCSFVTRTDFHNEYSILTSLKNNPGVIQLCDFFKDYFYEENTNVKLKRVCMVLECLIQHSYHNTELVPLNHYLKKNKLSETEALYIFYNLLLVLESLHSKNIVHKDLKPSNIILNRKTLKVKLIDFYYAEHLTSDNESPQRDLSHSSADVPFRRPVSSKTCDICSACVILYAMLNGCMPFPNGTNSGSLVSSSRPLCVLFLKFVGNNCLSDRIWKLLRNILSIPERKLKARDVADIVSNIFAIKSTSQNPTVSIERESSDQVVPECPDFDSKYQEECSSKTSNKSLSGGSEVILEQETEDTNVKEKPEKISKIADSERLPVIITKPTEQNSLLNRKEIKYAMLRLGATSINNINALSFNYNKKNSCRS